MDEGLAAALESEAAAWDLRSASGAGQRPPIALLAISCLFVVAAGVAGHVFLHWKDRLTHSYVELAKRRVIEFEDSSDGIFILNLDGGVEAINRAAERMLGRPRETIVREHILDIMEIAPGGETPFVNRLETANGPLTAAAMREIVVRRFDGGEIPADVTIRAMHMHDGLYIGVYVRDISDRKRVERLKDEFVSTVSHELRTPLTSIAGSLGLLVGGAVDALPEGPPAARRHRAFQLPAARSAGRIDRHQIRLRRIRPPDRRVQRRHRDGGKGICLARRRSGGRDRLHVRNGDHLLHHHRPP